MKKEYLTAISFLALALSFAACQQKEMIMPGQPGSEHKMKAASYACPMHPEVTDTKASKCPKCGMTLKPVG